MFNYSHVILVGRVTTDLVLERSSAGYVYLGFSIGMRSRKGDPIYANCVAFDKIADSIVTHFKKGDPVFIEGELDSYASKGKGNTMRILVTKALSMKEKKDSPPGDPRDDVVG